MSDQEKGNDMEDDMQPLGHAFDVSTTEGVDEFFRVLDAINEVKTVEDDGWDAADLNEMVQLILSQTDRPTIDRAGEAAGVIEARVRAYYNVGEPLMVPPEWEHRVPA